MPVIPICHWCREPLDPNENVLILSNGWKICEECQEDMEGEEEETLNRNG